MPSQPTPTSNWFWVALGSLSITWGVVVFALNLPIVVALPIGGTAGVILGLMWPR